MAPTARNPTRLKAQGAYRYTKLAEDLSARIRDGVLMPGDRIPSVRETSRLRGMSPNTVLEAYYVLEDRGEIESRPRSGYFVSVRSSDAERKPDTRRPFVRENLDVAGEMLEAIAQPKHVQLAGGWPSAALFPLAKLGRALKASTGKLDLEDLPARHPLGNAELRRFILRRAVGWGFGGTEDELVLTAGALEAINVCLDAVTRPGDLVAVEAVAAYNIKGAIERRGLRPVLLRTDPAQGVRLADLAAALRKQPIRACLLMPSYQNPLGTLMPEDKKRELVRMLARHEVPLIENDVYGELHFGPRRPLPAKAFDRQGLVLHCASFSKSLAPGYSVGWTLAGRFAGRVQHSKWMTNTMNGVLMQAALAEYLRQGGFEHHLRSLRRSLGALQERALALVARHFPRGTAVQRVQGGFLLWLQLPDEIDATELFRVALREGITVAPGQVFSADRRHRNCVRINFAQDVSPRRDAALATVGRLAASLAR